EGCREGCTTPGPLSTIPLSTRYYVVEGIARWNSDPTGQVRDLLAEGYSREQVLHYFENSYGEFVLLAAPKDGIALVVWVLPVVLLVGGVGVIWRLFTRAPAIDRTNY